MMLDIIMWVNVVGSNIGAILCIRDVTSVEFTNTKLLVMNLLDAYLTRALIRKLISVTSMQ